MPRQIHMAKAKKVLTGFLEEPAGWPRTQALLDAAGLELWQAPEGFWAIRLRQPPKPMPAGQPEGRTQRSKAR
jgi:hypothetical protein